MAPSETPAPKWIVDSDGTFHRNPSYNTKTTTTDIVQYAITGAIIAGIVGYFVIGYIHARMRIKAGLEPLGYHRWLIRRYRNRPRDLVEVRYHPENGQNNGAGNGAGARTSYHPYGHGDSSNNNNNNGSGYYGRASSDKVPDYDIQPPPPAYGADTGFMRAPDPANPHTNTPPPPFPPPAARPYAP